MAWKAKDQKPAWLTRSFAPALIAAIIALTGCTQVQSLPAEAEVEYDGNSSGSHSDKASCDADGTIDGAGDIVDGAVTVWVTDDEGNELYQATYDGSFDMPKTALTGHSGTWTIHADRDANDVVGDDFRGEYHFFLNCQTL